MKLSETKIDFINDVVSRSDNQDFWSYIFPILRFHERHDIEKKDFLIFPKKTRNVFMNASGMSTDTKYEPLARPVEFTDENYVDSFVTDDTYLTKIIELCKENNIEVVIIMPPFCTIDEWSIDKHNVLQEYSDKHQVKLIDFNEIETYEAVGLDASQDFYNDTHLNLMGGDKVSKYFAAYISKNFSIPDRRKSDYDPHWDKVTEVYKKRKALMSRILDGDDYSTVVAEYYDTVMSEA